MTNLKTRVHLGQVGALVKGDMPQRDAVKYLETDSQLRPHNGDPHQGLRESDPGVLDGYLALQPEAMRIFRGETEGTDVLKLREETPTSNIAAIVSESLRCMRASKNNPAGESACSAGIKAEAEKLLRTVGADTSPGESVVQRIWEAMELSPEDKDLLIYAFDLAEVETDSIAGRAA